MKNSARVSCAHLLKSPSTAEQSLFCKLVVQDFNQGLLESKYHWTVVISDLYDFIHCNKKFCTTSTQMAKLKAYGDYVLCDYVY